MYVRPEIFDQIEPVFVGWRGLLSDPPNLQWRRDGSKFEVASSTYALYEALRIAIAYADSFASQLQRYQRICELSAILWQRLEALPHINCVRQTAPESGLVSFYVNDGIAKSPAQIAKELEMEQQIFIRAIPTPKCLRASVHYLTTLDEIDRLVEAIACCISLS